MAANSRFAVAVHIVTFLGHRHASKGGGPSSSREIASSVSTHPVVIRRILADLARAGVVESRSGKNGGARLSKAPERITLLDVYRSIHGADDPCAFFSSHLGHLGHPRRRSCDVACRMGDLLDPVFEAAQRAAEAALRKVTIAQLLRKL